MEEYTHRPSPRRRRKTKLEIFKETYLPVVILAAAAVLILVFIAGAAIRDGAAPSDGDISTETPVDLEAEAERLLAKAALLAKDYKFQEALALLQSFPGDAAAFPELTARITEYTISASLMVTWDDPAKIPNLSFHSLVVDPARAWTNKQYGESYNKNFITVGEFKRMLQQIYDNGYVLISLDDIYNVTVDANGNTTCTVKPLTLPMDIKPLLLTQTNLNYYGYMVDGDDDGTPDKNGSGFANQLILDGGKIKCKYIDASGNTLIGDYDLVPILNSFIEEHPDFSYNGARAVIAVTGYDGLFGYRTDPGAKTEQGEAYYNEQVAGAKAIVEALKAEGYDLACYTYYNRAYGDATADEIRDDLELWQEYVTPILGKTDILVFAQNSELDTYSGAKFNVLQNAGFRRYLGFAEGISSGEIGSNYICHRRLIATPTHITYGGDLFAYLFEPFDILEKDRPEIPIPW